VYYKKGIRAECLAEAAGHRLTQTNNTSFLTSPLINIFGETGVCGKAFDAMLGGTFVPPPKCDQYMKKVLKHLTKPLEITIIELESFNEYLKGWKWA